MNIAKLNKRIQIIKQVSGGVDDEGFETEAVEELVWECWAKVSETSGTDLIKAGAEFSDTKKRFLIRYTPVTINTDMIIRYGGENYDIVLVNTYGDNHEYTEVWTERRELV